MIVLILTFLGHSRIFFWHFMDAPYASCCEEREALKLTLLWLFHKFGFLKKQKFEKILILSISWSFENFDFFPRIEFYIFLRRFQTVPGGWPRLGISSWWNHIWNIFGTNFPPNQTKIDQSNCQILTQGGLDGKVHPDSPNLEFKGSIDIIPSLLPIWSRLIWIAQK